MLEVPLRGYQNEIIRHLTSTDVKALEKYWEFHQLPKRAGLERRTIATTHVYFVESGLCSVLSENRGFRSVEVGLIGCEGLVGLSVVLEDDDPPDNDAFMKVAGSAYSIAKKHLLSCMTASPTLRQGLVQYANRFLRQVARTAAANVRNTVEERLSRWILLTSDRIGTDIPLTHEYLASMIGVHRPNVTNALNTLGREGLLITGRGQITVVDRRGLEDRSNGAYDSQLDARVRRRELCQPNRGAV